MKVPHTIILIAATLLGFFWGCSGSRQVLPTAEKQLQAPSLSARQKELMHERALNSFINGCAHDAKGELAEAILEYQDALQFEPNAAIYYSLSRDYALLGKSARAAEFGQEAVRLEPRNIAYHENLATVYLTAFQQDAAIREYETIVQIDSTYWTGWYNLARLSQPTKPLKSLEIYEKLLDRNGDEWGLLLTTAELYSSLGRYKEAAEKYRRMTEIDPSDRALQRQLAETYNRAGNMDEAIKILERMLEVNDRDLDVTAALGEIYLERKEYDRGIQLLNRLLELGIDNTELKLRVGIAFFGQAQRDSTLLPKAKKVFEELRQQTPRDWRVYWYLGAVAATSKQDSLAAHYFEMVTKLDERNGDAWWFVGSNYFDKGEYQKVLDLMDQAKQVLPNDFRVHLLIGLVYTRTDRQEEAAKELEQAYRLNPKDLNTLSTLALTYDGLKRYQDCDRVYEEALKLDSNWALILNNYSYSLAERGVQLSRALEMATKAVKAEPDNSSYLDTLGWIYFMMGKYDEAAVYIEKAVATDKASAVVVEHLGDAYSKLGKRDRAIEMWKKALELNPKNVGLKDKIERGTF